MINVSPKFSALYVFSPEKTQDIQKYHDQCKLDYEHLPVEQQAELFDVIRAEALKAGKKESALLHELTGDDTFIKDGHKHNPFVVDNQGRVDGNYTRGGILSDGRLFVATNTDGKLSDKFDQPVKDDGSDDDVTFWNKIQHSINMQRWQEVVKDPNMERMDQATDQLIPDTVYLEAVMAGRKINEIV